MPQILITGASRGIGLALSGEYARRGWSVLAACRRPEAAEGLAALNKTYPQIKSVRIDVEDHASIDALAQELAGEAIDVLCANAGIGGRGAALGAIDYAHWRKVMEVNLYGAMKTAEAFLPHVERSDAKKIIAVSSSLGSIGATRGGNYPYRSSKAALNMAFRSMAIDLKPRGVTVALLSPGIVDTDFMRGARVEKIPPQQSAEGLADVIGALTLDQSGSFIRYNDESVDW